MSLESPPAIRLAAPSDLLGIEYLGEQLMASDKQYDHTLQAPTLYNIAGQEDILMDRIAALGKSALCTVATVQKYDHDKIVGFALARVVAPNAFRPMSSVLLEQICVDQGYRGLGIGTHLLDTVVSWAAERDAAYVDLNVLAQNEAAMTFYQKAGFATVRLTMRHTLSR